jgi:hypothetical protein
MNESIKGSVDLGTLKAKETATMRLRDPNTGKDTDAIFTVYGTDSDVYRKAKLKIDRARAKKFTGRRSPNLDPAEIEHENLIILAACIKDWQNLWFGSEEFPYSAENAVRLLEEVPEVFDQLDQFVGDRRNFL